MFPPVMSSLSLDAYLLRYSRPKSVWSLTSRRSTHKTRELRKYRKVLKKFLTSLVAEVLRERLRLGAQNDGRTITSYLQDHQWGILKAIGNNQLIIDLVYPRLSETLTLTNWGPLLTCAVLKATGCLSKEEVEAIKVIDRMSRKYILKYKRIKQKGLKTVKQDWNTVCMHAQKLADSSNNAKLIKSVRNFIIEVSLPPMSDLGRPCTAPAGINLKRKLGYESKVSLRKRPATVSIGSNRTEEKDQISSYISSQRQTNYRVSKAITIPTALNPQTEEQSYDVPKFSNYAFKNIKTNKDIGKLEGCPTSEINMRKKHNIKSANKINHEGRLRKLSGRVRTPVPLPKTFADLRLVNKPLRLSPLTRSTTTVHADVDRSFWPVKTERGTISVLPPILASQSTRRYMEPSSRLHSQIRSAPTGHSKIGHNTDKEQMGKSLSNITTQQDFVKKKIKELVTKTIKYSYIEKAATDPMFNDKVFIDQFFEYLVQTNRLVQFLDSQNADPHGTWRNPDNSEAHFSFLHYFILRQHDETDHEETGKIYLIKKLLRGLTCDHDNKDDVGKDCWKCDQKRLAIDIAVSYGNVIVVKLLLNEGIRLTEFHLMAALKANTLTMFKHVLAYLKENEILDIEGKTARRAYDYAESHKMDKFVMVLQADGVRKSEEKTVRQTHCLPCFLKLNLK